MAKKKNDSVSAGSGEQSHSQRDIKIIAVTAFVNDESIENCYKVGMVEVLHKPVRVETIKEVLESYY